MGNQTGRGHCGITAVDVPGASQAHVALGASAGILNSSSNVALASKSHLSIELGGTIVESQYDQLNVTGTVDLGAATLDVILINGFVPSVGNQFTIIQSTGAITGQFAQGTSISSGGTTYSITYNANSVVLTVTSVSNLLLTVTRTGSGTGTVTSADGFINCGATCTHSYAGGTVVTLSATPAAGAIFTGWLGPCTGTGQCVATMDAAKTATATFALNTVVTNNKILDIDANNQYDALTDGLMVIRYLFGLSGTSVTNGAIGGGATRGDPTQIGIYLNDIRPYLDADGNGVVDAFTDGLLILRNLFGLTGSSLTQDAIGAGATRMMATDIQNYLTTLKQ
jgi:hypothetical protein